MFTRLNQYRIMWILVFFDLPTETPQQRKDANNFRKALLKDGFNMFQFSIYTRHCASRESMKLHINRIRKLTPEEGHIGILSITDKQFGDMLIIQGAQSKKNPPISLQLEMF